MAIGLLAGVLGAASVCSPASPGGLSGSLVGFVSNQTGVPQMGAAILLYNNYGRLVERSLTNGKGAFGFESLITGVYSMRVTLASFVPALKQNIKIQPGMRSFLSINLASVLSSIELIYAAPGQTAIMSDDWKWVLRTASATRPVLRIVPSVDISDPADRPARATAVFSQTRGLLKVSTGEEGNLAAAGTQADLGTAFALATSLSGGSQLQFSGNIGYASHAGIPTAGFRTSYSHTGPWGARPEVNLTMRQVFLPLRAGSAILTGQRKGAPALRTMSVSTLDRRQIRDDLQLEYGASLESVAFLERLNYLSPFARLTYEMGLLGNLQFAFNSGMPPAELLASDGGAEYDLQRDLTVLALLPRVSLRDSSARVQRTRNFEIAYRKVMGSRSLSVGTYHESVTNAAVIMAAPAGLYSNSDLLPDLSSNSSIFNLGEYRRLGFMASISQQLGERWTVSLASGSGGVLLPGQPGLATVDPNELRHMMRSGRRGWVATRVTGIAPWTGTRFAADYQWTDYSAFSPAHLYLTQTIQPQVGLNFRLRQPIPTFGVWSGRLEASAELRNLLAQGYVPVSTSDGRKLYLIQNPRAVRGGLSFIF